MINSWAVFLCVFMIAEPFITTWAQQIPSAAWPLSEPSRTGNCWAGNSWVGISASLLVAVQMKSLHHTATKFPETCSNLLSMNLLPFLEIKVPIRLKNDYREWSERAELSKFHLVRSCTHKTARKCLLKYKKQGFMSKGYPSLHQGTC